MPRITFGGSLAQSRLYIILERVYGLDRLFGSNSHSIPSVFSQQVAEKVRESVMEAAYRDRVARRRDQQPETIQK